MHSAAMTATGRGDRARRKIRGADVRAAMAIGAAAIHNPTGARAPNPQQRRRPPALADSKTLPHPPHGIIAARLVHRVGETGAGPVATSGKIVARTAAIPEPDVAPRVPAAARRS
jgi:hypothetical protein